MPIFEVEVSQTVLVESPDFENALFVALESVNEFENGEYEATVNCEVQTIDELKFGWDKDCIPYGGDGNTRLKDLLPAK